MLIQSDFKAAWWLSNPHCQTIAAKWLRRKEHVQTILETIQLPDDDFIDLAWTEIPKTHNTKPIVVLLHGLEGSVESHYAIGMLKTLKQQGWIGVLMHFRGCSGRPNKQAAAYHSGDTKDLNYLTSLLSQRYQHCKFALIGFSLGGNVITKYLAQQSKTPYQSAVIICAPLNLASCSKRINHGFSKIYQKYLVKMLKKTTLDKMNKKVINHIQPQELAVIKTIWDFDQYITAPLNGFKSAEDYYQKSSGLAVLSKISLPCLFIHASDDPFLYHQEIVPQQELPATLSFEVTKKGGHVGFITGNNPFKPRYWLEQHVPKYLEQYL